jgi:chemotaxis protein MotB
MSMKGQPIIVIKKKAHHGGHHGGAWKVAYADFVTAMMAFFLVMWLVNSSKAVKQAVGGYFRDPGVFETGTGGKGMMPGGTAVSPETSSSKEDDEATERRALEKAADHIKERIAQIPGLDALKNQIEFSVTPDGLRIDLLDKDKSSFFDSGSAVLRGETERILGIIAHELGQLRENVIIEGHTDSHAYTVSDHYSNWELSADRANAARRIMQRQGLRDDQVAGVRGLAFRQPRYPDNPADPRNRRVSILVRRGAIDMTKLDPGASPAVGPVAPKGHGDKTVTEAREARSN